MGDIQKSLQQLNEIFPFIKKKILILINKTKDEENLKEIIYYATYITELLIRMDLLFKNQKRHRVITQVRKDYTLLQKLLCEYMDN